MSEATRELWTPPSMREAEAQYTKAPAPTIGTDKYGAWAGKDVGYLNMPGGSLLAFDLSKLVLQDYRQMRDHHQVAISLALLQFQRYGLEWKIDGGSSVQNSFVEGEIRKRWVQIVRSFSQSDWAGFSPCVLEFSNDDPPGRIGLARVKDLIPEECRVNWKKVYGAPVGPAGVKPVFFEYDGIVQYGMTGYYAQSYYGPTNGYTIPSENTMWVTLLQENGDYYGRKLLRPAFAPWFFSQLMHLFSNRYFERFGEPVPIGRTDFEETVRLPDGTEVPGQEAMAQALEAIRNRSVVILPNDTIEVGTSGKHEWAHQISYLESQMRGVDFDRYMSRLDEEISLALLTPLLLTKQGAVGSYSLGQVHTLVYLWMMRALAGDMKHHLDEYIIKPLVEFNWGKNAPRLELVFRDPAKNDAELLRAIVTDSLRAGTIKPDPVELGNAVGLSFEEVTQLQAPVDTPGSQGPDGKPVDTRVGRPERPAKTDRLRQQVSARIASQVERSRAENHDFTPDFGYRRQVADALGVQPEEIDACYTKASHWVIDAEAIGRSSNDIATALERILEDEFDRLP